MEGIGDRNHVFTHDGLGHHALVGKAQRANNKKGENSWQINSLT